MEQCNVKVAVRVRPLVARERLSGAVESIVPTPGHAQIVAGPSHAYTYDAVYPSTVAQPAIFAQSMVPVLESFLEGFNCTVLAYGQTGSGKTYTMGTGLDGNLDTATCGVVPRSIAYLFEKACGEWEMLVSFLEIYNEEIIDLLNPHFAGADKSARPVLAIREDAGGEIYIAGIREEPVRKQDDVLRLLQKGSLGRTTKSTDMNSVSSRSHAIFTLVLRQQRSESTTVSKLHFVDLAGSERLKRTHAVGDRAKESISINSGLLALGNVISALGDETKRGTHVPYRDSKLTRLLQDSLGGNSRTVMIACVSPSSDNAAETLNTLKYAHRARNIKNRAQVNSQEGNKDFEIMQLRKQVAALRQQLLHAPSRTDGRKESDELAMLRAQNKELQHRLAHKGLDPTDLKKPMRPAPPETCLAASPEPVWVTKAKEVLLRTRTEITRNHAAVDEIRNEAPSAYPFDPAEDAEPEQLTATRAEALLATVQSDMALREELMQQLEISHREYAAMRAKYDERLRLVHENLLTVQRERDQALISYAPKDDLNKVHCLCVRELF